MKELATYISPAKAVDWLDRGQALLFDCRSPVKFKDGTWRRARNLTVRGVSSILLKEDKNKKLILFTHNDENDSDFDVILKYCSRMGFAGVYAIKGGYEKLSTF